jgi:hypothetical protein
LISCNVAPGGGERRGRPEFRRAGGALGRGRGGGGLGVQLLSVCGQSVGRGVSGELAWRPRQAPAARPPLFWRVSAWGKDKGRSGRSSAAFGRLKGRHATGDGSKRGCSGGSAHGGRDGVRARETAAPLAFIARTDPCLHAEGTLVITAAVRRPAIGLHAHRTPTTDRGTLHGAVQRRRARGVSGRGALGRREAALRRRAWGADAKAVGVVRARRTRGRRGALWLPHFRVALFDSINLQKLE